jgi:hypothetical protein
VTKYLSKITEKGFIYFGLQFQRFQAIMLGREKLTSWWPGRKEREKERERKN